MPQGRFAAVEYMIPAGALVVAGTSLQRLVPLAVGSAVFPVAVVLVRSEMGRQASALFCVALLLQVWGGGGLSVRGQGCGTAIVGS